MLIKVVYLELFADFHCLKYTANNCIRMDNVTDFLVNISNERSLIRICFFIEH